MSETFYFESLQRDVHTNMMENSPFVSSGEVLAASSSRPPGSGLQFVEAEGKEQCSTDK